MQAGVIKDEIDQEKQNDFEKEWARKKAFLPDFNLSAKSAPKIYNAKSILSDQDAGQIMVDYLEDESSLEPYVV